MIWDRILSHLAYGSDNYWVVVRIIGETCSGEETLFEALDEYVAHVKTTDVLPGTSDLSDYGHMKLKNVARLKERHENVPLSSLSTFDAVQAAVNLWRNRPMVKNSDPPRPITKKMPSVTSLIFTL